MKLVNECSVCHRRAKRIPLLEKLNLCTAHYNDKKKEDKRKELDVNNLSQK